METFQNRGRACKQRAAQFVFRASKQSEELYSEGARWSRKLLIAFFSPLFYCQWETQTQAVTGY